MAQTAHTSSKKIKFDPRTFLAQNGLGRTVIELKKRQTAFTQGESADTVFYIQKGRIKLTVISKRGKEATITLLGTGDFLGEECLAAIQPQRMTTATRSEERRVGKECRSKWMR